MLLYILLMQRAAQRVYGRPNDGNGLLSGCTSRWSPAINILYLTQQELMRHELKQHELKQHELMQYEVMRHELKQRNTS